MSGAYLAFYALAAIAALYQLTTHTANSEFSGLGVILLTAPWSLLWSAVMDRMGVIAWYGQFAGTPWLYGILATLVFLPAAIPNAAILYGIGRLIEKK